MNLIIYYLLIIYFESTANGVQTILEVTIQKYRSKNKANTLPHENNESFEYIVGNSIL